MIDLNKFSYNTQVNFDELTLKNNFKLKKKKIFQNLIVGSFFEFILKSSKIF